MKKKIFFFFLTSILLIGCIDSVQNQQINNEFQNQTSNNSVLQPTPLRIELTASDGMKIIGSLQQAKTNKAIIFLHQLNSSKEEFDFFAEKMNSKGFTVLSIDLRGHGESHFKNSENFYWQNFAVQDFLRMKNDVVAAYNYLKNELNLTEIYLVGASIGANTALNFSAENEVKALVLLSPSLDYKGITTSNSAQLISIPVFIACSKEDSSFDSCKELIELISSEKEFKELRGSKHGVKLLEDEYLEADLIEWIEEH
jgi:esterase/lipase